VNSVAFLRKAQEPQPTAAIVAYVADAIGQPEAHKMVAKTVATNHAYMARRHKAVAKTGGTESRTLDGATLLPKCAIIDTIQKKGSGSTWVDKYSAVLAPPGVIPAGTTLATATVFPYSFDATQLTGDIRNVATITITNHSGSLGTPKGPQPKATWAGGAPQPCQIQVGCTYTQGYWGNKPGVVWPTPYDRNATFFSVSTRRQPATGTSSSANSTSPQSSIKPTMLQCRVAYRQPSTWHSLGIATPSIRSLRAAQAEHAACRRLGAVPSMPTTMASTLAARVIAAMKTSRRSHL